MKIERSQSPICAKCGAPRARQPDGRYYATARCRKCLAAEQKERKRKRKATITSIRTDGQLPAHVRIIALRCSVCRQKLPLVNFDDLNLSAPICHSCQAVPTRIAAARRRDPRCPERLTLRRRFHRIIVYPYYLTNQILWLKANVMKSEAMPETYGELLRRLFDLGSEYAGVANDHR